MKRTRVIWILLIAAVMLGVVLRVLLPLPKDLPALAGTTNIVFIGRLLRAVPVADNTNAFTVSTSSEMDEVSFNINDPVEVQRLLSSLRLKSKLQCLCGPHRLRADFQTTNGTVSVSFCNHCFDVLDPKAKDSKGYANAHYYEMPEAFYARFRSHLKQQTNLLWMLSGL